MATKTATAKKATAPKKTAAPKKSTASKSSTSKSSKAPAKSDAASDLKDFFEDALKDIYWAEKALTKALPKMEKNATHPDLKKAISSHLAETEVQISRLEECFKALGLKPEAKKCDAMQGLLDEGKGIMEETKAGAIRDVGIIAASQKIEHYEIATYGSLAAYAKVLGEKKCLSNLLATLKEEKNCDKLLSTIADTALNSKAK
ncbi:ferritin-like domain-containing protein [Chryseobacterium sp. 09-1422]|uniref:Ferritin-like domain-containing protein n=1 Tax=Chryseobacterium kimseyorum TaxID=2984028 RepID=A0ABT3HWK4_9FLAO|nr:ferritin-like domain-containing protein [Chryseobacterium kimseyorum]MCW3168168.1 ferritin-like domain-containing protein [Chryseobacterium kimseyorum]